jgi:hypothetical protein
MMGEMNAKEPALLQIWGKHSWQRGAGKLGLWGK